MEITGRHNPVAERFEALRPRLKAWATGILGSMSDADDALQEAFFRLWRSAARGNDITESANYTAVRCACIDLLRRRSARAAEPIEIAESRAQDQQAEEMADMYEEVRVLIDRQLDDRQREILLLHDSLGYDYPEIASRLGITEANTRVILSRARKTIREAYRNTKANEK